jgi:NAD(P)-dependent dehydrogenase (short-subunit alcohol dehydrogenase family)
MPNDGAVVIVGGTRAIGLELSKHYASRGDHVVLTGQDADNVAAAVEEVRGLGRGRSKA